MMPGNAPSSALIVGNFLPPDDAQRFDLLVDMERGGIGISDPSQGLLVQDWSIGYADPDVVITPQTTGSPFTVFSAADITELALSFDQNMRPAVAYVQAGTTKLYWFDTDLSDYTHTTFAGATSPRLTLDDKRRWLEGASDVLFWYLKDGNLCWRQQRDRYTIERVFAAVPPGFSAINRVGMSTVNRIQIELN